MIQDTHGFELGEGGDFYVATYFSTRHMLIIINALHRRIC